MPLANYIEFTENVTVCHVRLHKAELPFLLLVSFISNLVATITLSCMLKNSRKCNLCLLMILAINDMLCSGTLLTSSIANTLTCDKFLLNGACKFLGLTGFSMFGLGLNLIALISVERFVMIVFPIYHHTQLTMTKLLVLVFFFLIVNIILLSLPLVGVGAPYVYYKDNKFCAFDWSAWSQNNEQHAVLVLFNAIYLMLSVVIVFISNITIFYTLKKRAKTFHPTTNNTLQVAQLKANKFALLTKVITAVNCVCSLPFAIKVMVGYSSKKTHIEGLEDSITSILLFMTPVINPFLYPIFNKTYRQYILHPLSRLQIFKQCARSDHRIHPQNTIQTTVP